ncbi:MAG: MFS transporter [Spirochaetaceae bacterium]|nr:MFS transporter [Spirochaetaceae bacterium]
MKKTAPLNRTIYLSRSERRKGGRLFLKFSALNGFGISFLGDATVTLLAIYFGATNLELGLISAMLHISGIFLLIIPRLFKGKNVVTVGFWAWMTRGFVSLPYIALLYIDGKPAVVLIMVLYALFCLSRTAGVAMVTTVQKRLMVNRTQSDVIYRNASSFQSTSIMARFISFLILSVRRIAELPGLVGLTIFGIIANTAAAFSFRRIPNRTKVDYQKGENLFVIFRRSMGLSSSRQVLFLRWISLAQTIFFAMTVPFLRRSAGLDSAQIFLYTIAGALAALISSLTLRPVAAKAGSRPLLFFSAIPATALFLLWIFIPNTLNLEIYALAGFFSMFFMFALNLATNRLLMGITPDEGAVGFNSMETFVTSILAIIVGFSAGSLADLSARISEFFPINDFGLVFLPAAIGSALQIILALKIDEPGSMRLAESARILTNVDNLRTWQMVSNLESTADPVKRKTLVHSVGHSRAQVASSEIGKILAEPLSQEKGELIDALFFTRRPELVGFLCDEASSPTAFHREKAIFALGAYPGERTVSVLSALLQDQDPGIQAAAAKSLGRIGRNEELGRVRELWKESRGLHEHLDLMIALFHMDPEKSYLEDLFSSQTARDGERMERTLFTLLSRQFGMSPPLGILYRDESRRFGEGLKLLLEESMDTAFLLEKSDLLTDLWQAGDFGMIWRLCNDALAGVQPPEEVVPIQKALLGFPPEAADSANALAALYFTYQILTSGAQE